MKIVNEFDTTQPDAPPDFSDWQWSDWRNDRLGKLIADQVAAVLWQQIITDVKDNGPEWPRLTVLDDGRPAIELWLLETHSLEIPLDDIAIPEGEDADELDAGDRQKLIAVFQGWIDRLQHHEGTDGT
jgi:hypothetical protein